MVGRVVAVGGIEQFTGKRGVTYTVGLEATSNYPLIAEHFRGANPFPVDVLVDRAGTIRYIAREYDPVAMTRVRLELRRPWSDGTTYLLFDPVELLARLAVLTPRPRVNLILYHGVLAPRAAWRSLVVQFGGGPQGAARPGVAETPAPAADCSSGGNRLWADLMRRSLGLDVLACPRCGGRLRLIALMTIGDLRAPRDDRRS